MSDGSLSQDEIDALLRGTEELMGGGGGQATAAATGFTAPTASGESLSDVEKNSVLDVLRAATESAASSMGALLSAKVSVGMMGVEVMRPEEIRSELGGGLVQVTMNYADGLSGENVFVIPDSAALMVANIAMGQNSQELTPMVLSTLSQTMTQAWGAAASNMSARLGRAVRFNEARAESAHGNTALTLPGGGSMLRLAYQLRIEGQSPVQVSQIMSMKGAREIINAAMGIGSDMSFSGMGGAQPMGGGFAGGMSLPGVPQQAASQAVGISSVQYPQLQQNAGSAQMPHNISVLMDVQMQLSVELGRTRKKISEILSFGEGSIIELDKLAGEPVDVLVNGKLIAKGEVVVIDENFGVRGTEIVSPNSRLEYTT